jgi:acetyl esterase/lipase
LCLFSPWVDLTDAGFAAYAQTEDPSTDIAFLKASADAYCDTSDRRSISPVFDEIPSDFPKTYVSTGSQDIMLPTLHKLTTSFTMAGADLQMKVWPGMWHVFELYDELPEAKIALRHAASFINDLKGGNA